MNKFGWSYPTADQDANKLSELLTAQDIDSLHHTSIDSFYHEQPDRFNVIRGNADEIPVEGGHMRWYESQLDALIAYNFHRPAGVLTYDRASIPVTWDKNHSSPWKYCLFLPTPPPDED